MTAQAKKDPGHWLTAAIFAFVALLLPVRFVWQGATKLYIDPPPVAAPARFEQHVTVGASIDWCDEGRFHVAQLCLNMATEAGKRLEVPALTDDEVRRLGDLRLLQGSEIIVGFWGDERPKVVSLTSQGRALILYEGRRAKIVERGRFELAFGAIAIFVIIGVFMWRGIGLVGGGGKESNDHRA